MKKIKKEITPEDRRRGYQIEEGPGGVLRICLKEGYAHIWMADLSYCPYCHISPEGRVAWAKENW